MSEESAKPPAPPAADKPKTSKALLGMLLLNLGATGFIAFKVLTVKPADAAPVKEPAPLTSEVTGPVLALDPFVVNLDEPGPARYLKVTLVLELTPDSEPTFDKSKQLIRDMILSHLSGLHLKDTLGSEAKEKLRTDLVTKLEKLVGPNKVRRMFFQEFVVQ
ncbi:MAG TPA: flagellar basal body-associated FliL family protein [Kofleriaceae bacterium]|nr:flagellar basal body-associated FliL family protein [Kofleriaceae bacterium]